MNIVANQYVNEVLSGLYSTNAYTAFQRTGMATQTIEGLGEVFGIALTGVASPIVAGISGAGKATEEKWQEAKVNTTIGETWTTAENYYSGVAYGTAIGVWEGVKWYVGGDVLRSWVPTGSRLANSVIRVGIDTAFSAGDTAYSALADLVTSSSNKTWRQVWNEHGGWNATAISIIIGLAGSTTGEVIDYKRTANAFKAAQGDYFAGDYRLLKDKQAKLTADEKKEVAGLYMKKYLAERGLLDENIESQITKSLSDITIVNSQKELQDLCYALSGKRANSGVLGFAFDGKIYMVDR